MLRPYQKFEAQAFHPDFGQDFLNGTIVFTNLVLRFEAGEIVIEIPLHCLNADFAADSEGQILLTDSRQPGLQISTWDKSILENRSVPSLATLAEQEEAQRNRHEMSRRLKLVALFLAGCGALFWCGMLVIGFMVRSIIGHVPPEFEKQYGDSALRELKAEMHFVQDTNQLERIQTMAAPFLRALPLPQPQWQFHIVENESPNAFALPGGHIVICSGLLQLAERPEELLGVLAHEAAHVVRKHGFRQKVASAGPMLICQMFLRGRSGTAGLLAGGSALLVSQSFSQEYESEADETGWSFLVSANIDPRGMIEIFQKLKSDESTRSKGIRILPHAFSSHPQWEKRIARLESKWSKLPRKSGFLELKPGVEP